MSQRRKRKKKPAQQKPKHWKEVLAEPAHSSSVRTVASPMGGQPGYRRKPRKRP